MAGSVATSDGDAATVFPDGEHDAATDPGAGGGVSSALRALPVESQWRVYSTRLPSVAKRNSFLVKENPQILDSFSDIIGGEYPEIAGSNDTIYGGTQRSRRGRKARRLWRPVGNIRARSTLETAGWTGCALIGGL